MNQIISLDECSIQECCELVAGIEQKMTADAAYLCIDIDSVTA